jgi:hypothetical protein
MRFLSVLIGIGLLGILLGPLIGGSSEPINMQVDVTMACEDFVKARLKSPGSAKFSDTLPQEVYSMPDGSYSVISWVDAQNSFGALLRSKYVCSVRKAPDGQWQLEKLVMER